MNEACQLITKKETSESVLVHIRGAIEEFSEYADLFDKIPKLQENDHLIINIASPGGCCDVGFAICDAVGSSECPVEVVVSYPSYSMGAILALCGDSLLLKADTFLMFHDYSSGSRGKGQELMDQTENYRKVFKSKFNRICQPFLSKSECERMFKGEDIYIHWDDPTLETRLKRHFK